MVRLCNKKYLRLHPDPMPDRPAGTVVMTASEVDRLVARIEARLDVLEGLLDERMADHVEKMRQLRIGEREAKRRRDDT